MKGLYLADIMAGMTEGLPSFGLTMEIDEAGCTNTTEVHFHLNCQSLVVLFILFYFFLIIL